MGSTLDFPPNLGMTAFKLLYLGLENKGAGQMLPKVPSSSSTPILGLRRTVDHGTERKRGGLFKCMPPTLNPWAMGRVLPS